MRRPPKALLAPALLLLTLLGAADAPGGPQYTPAGELIPPQDYREWIYLSTGIDMSYSEKATAMGHSMFDNVFVDPAAWRTFKATGHWPDKAMFVLEVRGAAGKGSINQKGRFQTQELMGLEAHVHDEARFKGGWGFFALDGQGPAKQIPYAAQCYSCHQAHGAVDTTFTQFYPTARPIAVKAGTFQDREKD
jgi:hypothetical protein